MSPAPDGPVQTMMTTDIPAVAALHRSAFPNYESTVLGPHFCTAMFRAYLRADSVIALVHQGPAVDGYLIGARPSLQRAVNDRLFPLAVAHSMRRALTSTGRAGLLSSSTRARSRRAVQALARRAGLQRARTTKATASEVDVYEGASGGTLRDPLRIVLIAVDRARRGAGVADELLNEFERRARLLDEAQLELVVDVTNLVARRCYERNGWFQVHDDGTSIVYRKSLGTSA